MGLAVVGMASEYTTVHHIAPRGSPARLRNEQTSPIDVIFDYDLALILQPDLVFISNARRRILMDRLIGPPDMVIEVLSPHPRIGKLQERIDWFAAYGVREIWLLHQLQERFEILGVEDGRVARRESFDYSVAIKSDVLPGFMLTLDDILRAEAR